MPQKCYIKPNRTRPRNVDAKAAARVYCKALEYGATEAEIELELEKCESRNPRRDGKAVEAALAEAQVALEGNNSLLESDIELLQRLNSFLGVVSGALRLLRLLPVAPLRAITVGGLALERLAKSRLDTIVVQRAANDRAIIAVKEAANDLAFLLRAGGR